MKRLHVSHNFAGHAQFAGPNNALWKRYHVIYLLLQLLLQGINGCVHMSTQQSTVEITA